MNIPDSLRQLLVSQLPQLFPRHTLVKTLGNAKLSADGKSRVHMVACDHHSLHAGPLEVLHCPCGLRPCGIPHAHHAKKDQIFLGNSILTT